MHFMDEVAHSEKLTTLPNDICMNLKLFRELLPSYSACGDFIFCNIKRTASSLQALAGVACIDDAKMSDIVSFLFGWLLRNQTAEPHQRPSSLLSKLTLTTVSACQKRFW